MILHIFTHVLHELQTGGAEGEGCAGWIGPCPVKIQVELKTKVDVNSEVNMEVKFKE